MEYILTFHILNVYVDKTQPHQLKFTFKDRRIPAKVKGFYQKVARQAVRANWGRSICCTESGNVMKVDEEHMYRGLLRKVWRVYIGA